MTASFDAPLEVVPRPLVSLRLVSTAALLAVLALLPLYARLTGDTLRSGRIAPVRCAGLP